MLINGKLYAALLIVVMALVTIFIRLLPFLLFGRGKETPPYISYLGKVLPQAIIGMLVIYCLKDINVTNAPFGLPELASALLVVLLQVWKHNALLSILGGTACYMLLLHLI